MIAYSQLPLPLVGSGGLTGQTMYNSQVWLKIVLFGPSLLAGRVGVAGVEPMTRRKSLLLLWVPGQPVGLPSQVEGAPFLPSPFASPNPPTWGDRVP